MRRAWADQTSCSVGGPPRTTGQMEEINADENAGEEVQRRQGKCPAEATPALGGADRGGRLGPASAGTSSEQGLGIHPLAQPAEPGEPPRNPGRRQAPEGVRE